MAGPFNTQSDYYNAASQYAVPSPESLDRAAARLRSRVDTEGAANQQALGDQYAGRGTTAGGGYQNQTMRNYANTQNAFSQGYGQLQDDYVKQQQAGAGILAGMGTQLGEQGIQNRGLDITQEQNLRNDTLQRYLQGQQLGWNEREQGNQLAFNREQLSQQGALTREQLEEQRQEAMRNSLQSYFSSLGQMGNTQFNDPGVRTQFTDLQNLIRQALGGGGVGGGGGSPGSAPAPGPTSPAPPAPPPPFIPGGGGSLDVSKDIARPTQPSTMPFPGWRAA
jgi:hypothetical protein